MLKEERGQTSQGVQKHWTGVFNIQWHLESNVLNGVFIGL